VTKKLKKKNKTQIGAPFNFMSSNGQKHNQNSNLLARWKD
jgi:hypothetical protein